MYQGFRCQVSGVSGVETPWHETWSRHFMKTCHQIKISNDPGLTPDRKRSYGKYA